MLREQQFSPDSTGDYRMEARSVSEDREQYHDANAEAQTMLMSERRLPLSSKFKMLVELTLTLLKEIELLKDIQELQSLDRRENLSLKEELRRFEIEMIRKALIQTNGHQSRAARLLGVKVTTLHEKLKRYDIDPNLLVESDDDDSSPDDDDSTLDDAGSSPDLTGEDQS
jgi:DNA-binding NtrC family response regulator